MKLKRLIHHFRLIVICTIGIGLGLVVGGLYYINQSGANEQWRAAISSELEERGVFTEFESLKFELTRGFVARGVTVYRDAERQHPVASLAHLVIDVDKTKLLRGILHVNEVSITNGNVALPLDPDDPDSPIIEVENLEGSLLLPDRKTVEAREISGYIEGIKVIIKDSRIWSEHLDAPKQPKPLQDARVSRIKMIARVLQEIHQWSWPENSPPEVHLGLVGNVDNPDTARLDLKLVAQELERSDVILKDVHIEGGYANDYITLQKIFLSNDGSELKGKADYHPAARRIRFDLNSSLHVQQLARRLFGLHLLNELTFSTPPSILCKGEVVFSEDFSPRFSASGSTEINNFSCLGTELTQLKTEFSVQGYDLFLTGLKASHREGELSGKILIKDETIRFLVESSLPADAYDPFLAGSSIQRVLKRADFTKNSKCYVTTKGTMNRKDFTKWSATGKARFQNISFNDVALHELSGEYELSGLQQSFSNLEAKFDYSDYKLRKKHGGPASAKAYIGGIKVDPQAGLVTINNIKATAWPAPIVRLFARGPANHVETYRFSRPPVLRANGSFDLRRDGNNTNFLIHVSSPSSTYYEFLGESLKLDRLRAAVRITDKYVHVTDLSFNTFQGSCNGHLSVGIARKETDYTGRLMWSRLRLKDIGKLYDFDNAERGLLTGGTTFSGLNDRISALNGKGSLSLEKGNLFSVPMLGPISPLLGVVLGKKNPTQERAKDASCKFAIRNGVVYSNDFLATTRSLKFTGEGSIDLRKKSIDLTVRMNARGLLGVLAIPLRPFMGLFQFKGTGAVSDPRWRTTLFTTPSRGKNDPIFNKRSRARVVPE